jgi:peptidoglycan/LPS O-acetylase OafA/YrhL
MFANGGVPRAVDRARSFLAPLAISAVIVIVCLPSDISPFEATSPVRGVFAIVCGLLILAVLDNGIISRLLSVQPLVFIGRISYSLYLWHVPVLAALGATAYDGTPGRSTVAVVGILGIAAGSYSLVERPLRNRWAEPRQPRATLKTPVPAVAITAD